MKSFARVSCLNDELGAEDVGEFGSEAVAASRDLLLAIIVVRRREQLTEDHLRHVALVFSVHLNRYTLAVVPDPNHILLRLDVDFELRHRWISLKVVGGIDQNLVKYFVETRTVTDIFVGHFLRGAIEDPKSLSLHVDAADVSVWSKENVLQLSLLLIDLLDALD